MTTVLDTSTVLRSDRVVFRPQGDRVLVYRPANDQLYLVPVLAQSIVTACDGRRRLADVLQSVGVTETSVGDEGVRKVLDLVSGLIDREVLLVVDEATAEVAPEHHVAD
jgi:hypothetical protein